MFRDLEKPSELRMPAPDKTWTKSPVERSEDRAKLALEMPMIFPHQTSRDLYFEWMALLSQVRQFQEEKFADLPLESWLKHMREECGELLENPGDRMEKADVIFIAFGLLNRLCADPDNLPAAREKLEINKKRTWVEDAEGNVRHLEEG